jgi:chromosome segregation ATPase
METALQEQSVQESFAEVLQKAKGLNAMRHEKETWESERAYARRNPNALLAAGKVPADEFNRLDSRIVSCEQRISELKGQIHFAFESWVRELRESDEYVGREVVIPGRSRLKSLLEEAAALCEKIRESRKQIISKAKELDTNRKLLAVETQEPFESFGISLNNFVAHDIPGIRREDYKGDFEFILRSVSSQI